MTGVAGPGNDRFELVIFDNDGVLVDSEHLAFAVLDTLLVEHGLPLTHEESIELFLGGPLERVVEWSVARGRPLPDEFVSRYHTDLFVAFERELAPVGGAADVVDRIARAATVCVASSGTRERIVLALTRVGLLDRFGDRIFSADDVEHGKPAPDLFLHAAAELGIEPAACVVVEDSPAGIEAANAAGMDSVGLASTVAPSALAAATLGVIGEMSELPGLLGVH